MGEEQGLATSGKVGSEHRGSKEQGLEAIPISEEGSSALRISAKPDNYESQRLDKKNPDDKLSSQQGQENFPPKKSKNKRLKAKARAAAAAKDGEHRLNISTPRPDGIAPLAPPVPRSKIIPPASLPTSFRRALAKLLREPGARQQLKAAALQLREASALLFEEVFLKTAVALPSEHHPIWSRFGNSLQAAGPEPEPPESGDYWEWLNLVTAPLALTKPEMLEELFYNPDKIPNPELRQLEKEPGCFSFNRREESRRRNEMMAMMREKMAKVPGGAAKFEAILEETGWKEDFRTISGSLALWNDETFVLRCCSLLSDCERKWRQFEKIFSQIVSEISVGAVERCYGQFAALTRYAKAGIDEAVDITQPLSEEECKKQIKTGAEISWQRRTYFDGWAEWERYVEEMEEVCKVLRAGDEAAGAVGDGSCKKGGGV